MFKRVFKSIGRAFSSEKPGGKGKEKEPGTESAADRYRSLKDADVSLPTNAAPEKLCGITKAMTQEEIEAHLTQLYRRHNRAASSLDPKLREEAEVMLDAIVEMRMKYSKTSGAKA